jgi:hypothetical protein
MNMTKSIHIVMLTFGGFVLGTAAPKAAPVSPLAGLDRIGSAPVMKAAAVCHYVIRAGRRVRVCR